jgi:hypothetical protein
LALYAATLAPGLTWAHRGSDGGDFLAAALVRGVPHPSGYPTYELLLRAVLALTSVEPARAGAWLSAVCAAVGLSLVAWLSWQMLGGGAWNGLVALAAALSLAASPALWSQAVITEAHALHFLLCALLMVSMWRWRQAPARGSSGTASLSLAGLTVGLGLGNHLSFLLFAPAVADWLWRNRRLLRRNAAWGAVLAGLLGLAVYLYLPAAASGDPPVNWGDPRTPGRFWGVVSAQVYRPLVFGVGLGALPGRIGALTGEGLRQLGGGPWGMLIAVLGLWRLDHNDHDWWRFTLLTALAFSVYAIGFNTSDSYLYLIPVWTVAALWLAVGLSWGIERLTGGGSRRRLALALAVAALALPVVSALRFWDSMDARRNLAAQHFLDAALAEAAPNAIILSAEDAPTFALWYGIYGLGRRPDLTPVNVRLYAFPWYRRTLASHHPQLFPPADANSDDVGAFVATVAGRLPVYRAGPLGMELPGLTEEPVGMLVKMTPQ